MWRHFGCSSLVDYMEREMGYSAARCDRTSARRQCDRRAAGHCRCDGSGQFVVLGARELTRIVTPETQQAWLDAAEDKSSRQIEEMVRGHQPGDLPSDAPDPALRTKVLRFEVKLSTAALERQAMKKLEKDRGDRLDDDAFMRALFLRVIEGTSDVAVRDRESGNEGRPDGRSRYQIAVMICRACKRGWHDVGGESVELSPAAIECAQCDGRDIGSIDDEEHRSREAEDSACVTTQGVRA